MGKRFIFCLPDDDNLNNKLARLCDKALEMNSDVMQDIGGVASYDELKMVLRHPEYVNTDYVLVSELMCDADGTRHKLTPSFLKDLCDTFTKTRFIVIMPSEEKNKLVKFYEQEYYDAVFLEQLESVEAFAEVFRHERTREEALAYYAIEALVRPEEPVVAEEEVTITPEFEPVEEMVIVTEEVTENVAEDKEDKGDKGEFVKVEQPYMNWISVSGFVTGFTGADTVEVKIPPISNLSEEDLKKLMPGSPVNITIALSMDAG